MLSGLNSSNYCSRQMTNVFIQIFFDNETKSDRSWLVGQLILDHLSSSAAGPLVNFFVDEIKQRLYVIEADQPQQRLRIFIQQLIVNKESFTGYAPDFVRSVCVTFI